MNPLLPAAGVPARGETHANVREHFRRFSTSAAGAMGSPWAFVIALLTVVVWAMLGPRCRFSDTWQLVINTSTTIITFLMVFLIQNTQNRDARAIQLKLDELIRGSKRTRNQLIDLENCNDEELAKLEEQFKRLRARSAPAQNSSGESGEKKP